jgi:hypothetical protein|tara:strand:+ start:14132 stop:14467 length:336 start_codon:yes stop_codon:yes gene_type:complete
MAQDFKRYIERSIGSTGADIPNAANFSTNDTIIGINLANISTLAIKVSVYIKNNSLNYYLVKDAPIPTGGALQIMDGGAKIVVQSGDQLNIVSDTANSVDAWVSVVAAISS